MRTERASGLRRKNLAVSKTLGGLRTRGKERTLDVLLSCNTRSWNTNSSAYKTHHRSWSSVRKALSRGRTWKGNPERKRSSGEIVHWVLPYKLKNWGSVSEEKTRSTGVCPLHSSRKRSNVPHLLVIFIISDCRHSYGLSSKRATTRSRYLLYHCLLTFTVDNLLPPCKAHLVLTGQCSHLSRWSLVWAERLLLIEMSLSCQVKDFQSPNLQWFEVIV